MKRLYFIRHGESEANRRKIIASRSPSPLTKLGEEQAKLVGTRMKEVDIKIDLMLVSPLLCTQQTADIVSPFTPPLLREEYPDIIERDLSALEGQSYAGYNSFLDYEKQLPDNLAIESMDAMLARAHKVLDYVRKRPEETIVLVSHGSFGMSLLEASNYPDYDALPYIDNCAILRLV